MSAGLPDRRLCVIVAKTWWGVDLRRRHGDAAVVRACRASLRRRDAAAASMCVTSSSACSRGPRRAPAAAYGPLRLLWRVASKPAPRRVPAAAVARRQLRGVRSSCQSSVCNDAVNHERFACRLCYRKTRDLDIDALEKFLDLCERSFRSRGTLQTTEVRERQACEREERQQNWLCANAEQQPRRGRCERRR